MERLRKLSLQGRASAWSVKRLVSYVRSSGLSTISRTVDDFANAESEITSESEARNCAQRVFKNVAKPGARSVSLSLSIIKLYFSLYNLNDILFPITSIFFFNALGKNRKSLSELKSTTKFLPTS